MSPEDVKKALDLIDGAGVSFEKRRHSSSSNRRAEAALVIANAESARQVNNPEDLDAALALAGELLTGNPP